MNNLVFLKSLHNRLVFNRRAKRLGALLAQQIPDASTVLDIGCGDGTIASLITAEKRNVSISGIDINARKDCKISCQEYDGKTIPFRDNSHDVCLFVDVLHHTDNPLELIQEARRVSRGLVIIKDHLFDTRMDLWILQLMDWIGNRPYGVVLPYNFLNRETWDSYFERAGLTQADWVEKLHLYPPVADAIFGRHLHFIAALKKKQ